MKRLFLGLTLIIMLVWCSAAFAVVTTVNITPAQNLQTVINNCTAPSASNIYDIVLAEGIYDITNIGASGAHGIQTRDYVNIKGATTDKSLYVIKMERSDGAASPGNYEAITLGTTTVLENLTITVLNGRYPVHYTATSPKFAVIRNCRLENLGNWISGHTRYATYAESGWFSAHGLGVAISGGDTLTIDGCEIVGRYLGGSIGGHTNPVQTAAAHMVVTNSHLMHPDGGSSIQWDSAGTNQNDTFVLTNNILDTPIVYQDNASGWPGTRSDHNETVFTGSGNTYPYFMYHVLGGSNLQYRYIGEHHTLKTNNSGSSIPFGAACASTGASTIRLMTSSDDPAIFAGFAAATIASGADGYVQYTGSLADIDTIRYSEALTLGDTMVIDPAQPGRLKKGTGSVIARFTDNWPWWRQYTTGFNGLYPQAPILDAIIFTINPAALELAAIAMGTTAGHKSMATGGASGVGLYSASGVQLLGVQNATDDAAGAIRVKPGKSMMTL